MELTDNQVKFPETVKQHICQAVRQITIEDLDDLFSKHESDPENFDGRVEANLRNLIPAVSIETNYRISKLTRFNSDIFIQTDNSYICLEIEKGYLSRFEFDILKMQVFASNKLKQFPNYTFYGGFIVPADNIVAAHIAGNSRESSFRYLCRLSRLVAQIRPKILEDILIIGYSTSAIPETIKPKKEQKVVSPGKIMERQQSDSAVSYLIDNGKGLIDNDTIKKKLSGYSLDIVFQIKDSLSAAIPDLHEKLNYNSRYLGYAKGNNSDALYIYIQKKQLVLDVRVSKEEAENLRKKGFRVNPRNNYQCRAGWLTGLSVPYDTDRLDVVVELALMALEGKEIPVEDKNIESVMKQPTDSSVSYLIDSDRGLIDNDTIKQKLSGYPLDIVFQIKDSLSSAIPDLHEKFNYNSRYLGYAKGNNSDAVYIYIQKKQLVLDVRVSKEEAENLRRQGFSVNPRNNYQCRAGWLTGLSVPYDTDKLDVVVELALMALEG